MVKVVANIHVSLQFCGNAALKRRIRITERARRKIYSVPFFHTKEKVLIVALSSNFKNLLVSNQFFFFAASRYLLWP